MYLFSNTAYCGITMTNLADLPPHLQARYGYHKPRFRKQLAAAFAVFLLLGPVAYSVYRAHNPTFNGELTAFKVVSAQRVDVYWKLQRPENVATYCVLRAQDIRKTDVGYATVRINAGPALLQTSYALATNGQAVLAEVLACSGNDQMRVPPANFPPGVQIPPQQSPGVAPKL